MSVATKIREKALHNVSTLDSEDSIKKDIYEIIHRMILSHLKTNSKLIEHSFFKNSEFELQYFIVLKDDKLANRRIIDKFFNPYIMEKFEKFPIYIHYISMPAYKELKKNSDFTLIQ